MFLVAAGCFPRKDTGASSDTSNLSVDFDGDGYLEDDCDDANSLVNPGMPEACADGIDQDCDGADASCPDMDGDGFSEEDGDCDDSDATLTPEDADGDGVTSCDGDCNDADPAFHPGADELDCTDLSDYNCDGSVAYADADADGWVACEECDDFNNTVNPDATETWYDGVDSDCSGGSDYDADADGYDSANFGADDCDDLSSDSHPGAAEACDDADNDCNGLVDDGVGTDWYVDNDGDGYGNAAVAAVVICDGPAGYVENALDCDDASAAVSPLASEACNGVDDDCNGIVPSDEVDADGDLSFACDDCDDADEDVSPLAEEVCGDGIDNDCDASDDMSGDTYYADADGDGYGNAADTLTQCGAPAGYVLSADDCDDMASGVNPGSLEVCDGLTDEDCDGLVDENDASDAATWYLDADADGYGDGVTYDACVQPAGYVAGSDDCDDASASVNPGATETCDGTVDEDCDGLVDEGVTMPFYADADGDGWGSPGTLTEACSAPAGYVTDNSDCDDADAAANHDDADADGDDTCAGDCDDADAALDLDDMDGDGYSSCEGECNDSESGDHPGAVEQCDGRDNDCNGAPDDTLAFADYYRDGDSDGYGDAGFSLNACEQPVGYAENDEDCDDADYGVSPGAVETCDGEDDDCDGTTDEGFDADADGFLSQASCGTYGTDCDDADAGINASAVETCDGVDEDCDGTIDDGLAVTIYYADADADGDGDGSASLTACATPSGYVTGRDDCDDADASLNADDADGDGGSTCAGDCDDASVLLNVSDADGDGVTTCDGDCDDAEITAYPGGSEIAIVGTSIVDLCSDGLDNDCDGLADTSDPWDCDDDDTDGVENGIDVLVAMDGSGDLDDDTLCVIADADLSVASPWDGYDAIFQGDAWGDFDVLNSAYAESLFAYADSDGDGTDDVSAWCYTFVGAVASGNWNGRFVSATAEDASSTAPATCNTSSASTTWVPMNIADYCTATGDDWCREGYADFDGCGDWIGTVVAVTYTASTESIAYVR